MKDVTIAITLTSAKWGQYRQSSPHSTVLQTHCMHLTQNQSKYQVLQNKVAPKSFSLFSQQPFGILISNFNDLFSEIFYV